MASEPSDEQTGAWQGQTGNHDKNAQTSPHDGKIGSHFAAPSTCDGLIVRQAAYRLRVATVGGRRTGGKR